MHAALVVPSVNKELDRSITKEVTKSKRAHARSFVFKRQRKSIPINNSSESLLLDAMIVLTLYRLWVPRGHIDWME
jgi:hypothetical protein